MSPRFRTVIRVFVSSTFSDLKEERNALQREVFPRLEHYCLVRGFQFQAIDLRWGVPGEAGRDHRTMQICFDELRRAQEVSPRPNFLVLLGDRYGWQPLAECITEAEFQALEGVASELDGDAAREAQARGSATEALRTWYRRDDNAVPVEYQLRSRNDWPGMPEWTEEDEDQAWKKVEQTLWAAINRAYPQERLAGRFRQQIPGPGAPLPSIVKFQASATEQEIWCGALAVPDAPEHVVAWYRTIRNRDQYQHDPRGCDFFDPSEALQAPANALRDDLRRRLHRDGKQDIHPVEVDLQRSADGEKLEVTRDHLQPMCDAIEARLREIVDEEIRAYWSPLGDSGAAATPDRSSPNEARKLELEAQAHQLFGESRAPKDSFVGRDAELKAIADYLSDENDRNPLVVHGQSGTGKTALLARAAQAAAGGERRIFVRFLGTTPQSSNLRSLLQNLCRALRPAEEAESQVPAELRELQEEFDRLLALATAEKPILLFLDALDQLDDADGARQTYWLRTPLPPHVKVVVSCIRDEEGPTELNESYRSFDRRKLLDRAIAIESLTAPEAMSTIRLWLQHDHRRPGRCRRLTKEQFDVIAARITPNSAAACRRPLYLRILFEECRLWPSWKKVEPDELGEDTAALLEGLFDRLAQPAVHGALLVEAVLSYIASARRGLSENEILEVLWADPDYRRHLDAVSRKTMHELPPEATRIPIAIWSRLRHDLDPYLAEHSAPGGVVLSFYHRVVGRVVKQRLLSGTALQTRANGSNLRRYHLALADYFEKSSPMTPRKAEEWPWQLCRSESWERLERALTDPDLFLAVFRGEAKWDLAAYWLPLRERGRDPGASYLAAYNVAASVATDDHFRALLANEFGMFLFENGSEAVAEDLLQRALAITEKVGGLEDRQFLTNLNNLALVLTSRGKFKEAESMFRRVLASSQRLFGAEYPVTLQRMASLAAVLMEQEDLVTAELLLRQALPICERVLGPEHPHTLLCIDNLAELLVRKGDDSAAEPFLRRSLETVERLFGHNHPENLGTLRKLADLLERRGDYRSAEALYPPALAGAIETLGKDHPKTLAIMSGLGLVLTHKSDYGAAEPLLRNALQAYEQLFGDLHPDTLNGVNNLAYMLEQKGDYQEAAQLHRRALHDNEELLGKEHRQTLISVNNLACVLAKMGDSHGAESLYRRAMESQEKTLGPDHSLTLISANNLAELLQEKGDLESAEALSRRTLEEQTKVHGPDHPDTLIAADNLAGILMDKGEYDEAEPLRRRALEGFRKVLGPGHPRSLTAMNNMASLFEYKKDYAAAVDLLKEVLQVREHNSGSHHADTIAAMQYLARALGRRGEFNEAERLGREALDRCVTAFGEDKPLTLASLKRLADIFAAQNKFIEAEGLLERALAICPGLPNGDQDILDILNHLSEMRRQRRIYPTAEPWLRRGLEISTRLRGSGHPDTVKWLNDLATALYFGDACSEAEPLYRRAVIAMLKIRAAGAGPEAIPELKTYCDNHINCLTRMGLNPVEIRERIQDIVESALNPNSSNDRR